MTHPEHLFQGGVCLLIFTLLAQVIFHNQAKKLSVDLGGAKRVHALSTVCSALLLLPWAAVIHWNNQESVALSFSGALLPLCVVILTVPLLDFYVESVCSAKLDPHMVARYGAVAVSFLCYCRMVITPL